jgi:hypothetical protein
MARKQPPSAGSGAREVVVQLDQLCDLIGYQTYLGRKTKFGKRPGPSEWHFTREYLAKYAPDTDADQVIDLFKGAGQEDEIHAAMWVALNQEHIP